MPVIPPDARGLRVLIRVTDGRAEVLFVSPVEEWSDELQTVLPHSLTTPAFVLRLVDDAAATLGLVVREWETDSFGDRPGTEFTDDFSSGDKQIAGDRLLEFPLPAAATWLHLGKAVSDQTPTIGSTLGTHAFAQLGSGVRVETLGLLPLRGDQPPPAPLAAARVALAPYAVFPADRGVTCRSRRIVLPPHPGARRPYRIALLAEGFQNAEEPLFNERCDVLVNGLLDIEPFKALAPWLSFTSVFVPSPESGVDRCPYASAPERDTAFDVTGNYGNEGYAGYFGTDSPQKIEQALVDVFGTSRVDLVMVIVNVAIYGGRGAPSQRTAFVPIHFEDETFINLAAHESAHAMASLREEYISPVVKVPPPNLNVVSEEDRIAGTVWWESLAKSNEVSNGCLKFVHKFGDPMDPDTYEPRMPNAPANAFGLFWGAQYIAEFRDCGCDIAPAYNSYADPRSAHFYRSMARCKMRRLKSDFCRVCQHLMKQAVCRAIQLEPCL